MLAGSSGQSTGYTIDQSIRFNDDDSPALKKTYSGAGTEETFTFSCWVKRGNTGASLGGAGNYGLTLFSGGADVSNYGEIRFESSGYGTQDSLFFYSSASGSINMQLATNRVFRDPSAWYHIICVMDTTNSIASERMRMYVNGERETSFNAETYPAKDTASNFNTATEHGVGVFAVSTDTRHFDGYLAEIHFLDGYAYGPEYFGEFDDYDNWIPKQYSGSYGTNGFKIDGRDSSDLGDDESGNGNDYTTSGLAANDQVSDTPTNNFCVMNPLASPGGSTFAEGNLKVTMASGTKKGTYSSFAIDSGKWYVEGRLTSTNNGSEYAYTGIEDYNSAIGSGQYIGRDTYGYSYDPANGAFLHNNSNVVSSLPSVAQGDIIQIAVDLDNNAIYWGKNGTFLNSGNPASGASKTGGVSIIAASSQPSGHYHIGHSNGTGSSGYQSEIVWNFGQDGTFAGGTTAGGNSDGNGIGNFKYSVPSGYLALCTKNLFSSGG